MENPQNESVGSTEAPSAVASPQLPPETVPAGNEADPRSLWEREQRHMHLLAAASDYMFTVIVDHGHSVATTHGPGCLAVTGHAPEEFQADPDLWYRIIYEDDRPLVLAHVARILKGETPPPLEHRLIHKDGLLRYIRNVSVPHTDPHGRVVAYDGLIADITRRKQAEQLLFVQYTATSALTDSDTLAEALSKVLKTLCENMLWDMAAFWRFDLASKTLRCEEAWHFRSVRLEKFEAAIRTLTFAPGLGLPGSVWASGEPAWIPDVRADKDFTRGMQARQARLRGACAFPIRRGKEMVGVIELFSRQVQKPNPQMLQALKVMGTQIGQFIERKRAAEVLKKTLADLQAAHEKLKATQLELIQAAKLESLGTLAAGVAHEVKNPLQTILMGLDYFSKHVPLTDEAVKQIVVDMRDAVVRADRIIHEMLHLSADSKILIKPENLNEVVERSVLLVDYKLTAGRINVVRELAPGLPFLSLDQIRMEQVFLNLFINAMHAMPEGGTLTIRTRADRWPDTAPSSTSAAHDLKTGDPIVVVEVQDSGVGIPEANLVKLFDPFFTTKPSGVGTGLGLSVIKKIMALHDGLITIRNAPSRGALVTLTLKAPTEAIAAGQ